MHSDDVFEKAEAAAQRLRMSRSELYARAVDAYVDAHPADAVTESWNAALAEMSPEETAEDLAVARASARLTMKRITRKSAGDPLRAGTVGGRFSRR